ncbi:ribonuclease [Bacillus thuringiensis]|uniref:ribonuclease n=1 Tax=Bacillus thuringiensis TaxID=1428 RepID=UPI000BF7691B|nr:ribonuclease [Bacillus thuringiensis]PFA22377.1 ribonuclease [Bacillus thuringiensis]PGN16858.1 ribonuclease [Bacillus thuringiensis]
MNKKLIIGAIAVIVVVIASISIFKDSKSEDMKPKYSQKDMDKVIDKHFNEQQELKTQIKELKSKVDSYEKEQTRSLQKTTQPIQEKTEPAENADKVTYEKEIKPTIDEMLKEYDEIWNQDWKAIWGEGSKDPESLDKNALKEKMESVANRYDALSKKNTEFKSGSKLTDPVLKEKIEKFRVEFGLATNYRSNAGRAVNQGIKGLAPMKDRMNEAQKSVKLSDQKLSNALASLNEIESKLGISRN